jgi:hypothetical protein
MAKTSDLARLGDRLYRLMGYVVEEQVTPPGKPRKRAITLAKEVQKDLDAFIEGLKSR